jgi:hypothetical protein
MECPWCKIPIEIVSVNCGTFRCGISKFTFLQIDPHLPENKCNELIQKNEIYGCAKPFQLKDNKLIKCGWI